MDQNQELSVSTRRALLGSTAVALGVTGQTAVSQEMPKDQTAALEEITVTGTRIRRTVDEATAAPITVIDSEAISRSGFQTAGDILAQLPGIAGQASSPAVNVGGARGQGFGESNVELRGLDAKRTLVLIDGRRVGIVGGPTSSGAVDINQIPVNVIDHVDVLKEGAGAIYGSDAIAGVVNFVTRKGIHDVEIGGEYGQTSHSDARHKAINIMWGGSGEKFDFVVSGNYNKQDALYAARRSFSKDALYLYSGSSGRHVSHAGSSRVPNGRASLPNNPYNAQYNCTTSTTKGINVTRIPGTDGTALSDYQCLHGTFNYQPFNLLATPQERGAMFFSTTYHINDELDLYAEFLNNKTHSGFEFAPLPFDATADNVVISAKNEYNPFGMDFGGLTTPNENYRTRFVTLGDRYSRSDADSKIANLGLRGKLPGDWQWDLNLGYNRLDQNNHVNGYVYFPGLQAEVGPSFQNPDGSWGCGTNAANAIAGCTPINFFNLNSPASIAALQALNTSYSTNNAFVYKTASVDFNGSIVHLPAGDLRAAVGFQYQDQTTNYVTDYVIHASAPLYTNCLISEEACSGDSAGGYNSKELYGEALIPILKDAPGAKLLNLDIGIRWSDYSLFGTATKSQFKVEYKPTGDLLLRGTFAQVFRAPTLTNLFAAPLNNSANYADPCYGTTPASVAANPNLAKACNGAYQQNGNYAYSGTSQVTAVITSNPDLKPETGTVWTTGFVLQVPGIENLSLTADFWNYDIHNVITQLDPNYISQQCVATGNDTFCSLIHRFQTGNNQGQIEVFQQPTVNLGELKTNGIDYNINYKLKNTRVGSFVFDVNATYINKYDSIAFDGAAPQHIVGTYDRQFGNYAKLRGLGQVVWGIASFDTQLQMQYIDKLVVHTPATQAPAVYGSPNPDLKIGSTVYFNATFGYTIKASKTRFQAGIQNIADKQPPILYQNNVLNANTDVSTYDLLGRRFFVSFLQKF